MANVAMNGGGVWNNQGQPAINGCTFTNNIAHESGGGVWNEASSPSFANCVFFANRSVNAGTAYGGGAIGSEDSSDVTIMHSSFVANFAFWEKGVLVIERVSL